MKERKEMYNWPEYWLERIQNEIYRAATQYMENENLNQNGLAEHLKVSKGYVSQILNGNFNFSLSTLINICLKLNVVPEFELKTVEEFMEKEELRLDRLRKGFTVSVSPQSSYSLNPENTKEVNAA
jgi:transcriptional regulator with XRE-family HTH domain